MAVAKTSRDKHKVLRQIKDTDLEVRLASLEQKISENNVKSNVQTSHNANSNKSNRNYTNSQHRVVYNQKNCAVSNDDQRWKDDLLKKVETLQQEQIAVVGQSQHLMAKNESLTKEVE